MNEIEVSVTEAARNFSDCVNQARYRGTTFVLLKNGLPVARITSIEDKAPRKICTGRDLAAALATVDISDEELLAWGKDIEDARNAMKQTRSPWQSQNG